MALLRFCLLLLTAAALSSCATANKTAATTQQPASDRDEYVNQTTTGSWITKKVRKSQAQPTAQETEQAQRALDQVQRQGSRQPSGN